MPSYPIPKRPKFEAWNGDIQALRCIGRGASGLIFEIDEQRVAKIAQGTPRSIADIETERKIYRKIRQMQPKTCCPYILTCLETENPRGLVFERYQDNVRNLLRSSMTLSREERLRIGTEASEGLANLHDFRIIQGDVGCHNMLVDSRRTVKMADFAGSSINGSAASVNYEVRSRLPGISRSSSKADMFALGSSLYEIATGHPPYEEKSYGEVQYLYRSGIFPSDVDKIPDFGPIIRKCWQQGYESTWDVVDALKSIRRKSSVCSSAAADATRSSKAVSLEAPSKSSRNKQEGPIYVKPTSQRRATHRHDAGSEGVVFEKQERTKRDSQSAEKPWINRFVGWPTRVVRTAHENPYRYH